MGFQEISEIVELGYPQLEANSTKQQRLAHKENKRKDCKAMCLPHQCVDVAHFEKIASAQSSQEAWQILEKFIKGTEYIKKVRLQTMRRQYELMQMELNEKCPVLLHDHLSYKPDESLLEDLKLEDLHGFLEAHEQRLIERSTDKDSQALQAQTCKKGIYFGKNSERNRGRGKDYMGKNSSNAGLQDQERTDLDQASTYSKRGGGSSWRGGKKKVDKKRVKCFNCSKLGHFSSECQAQPRYSDAHNRQHHDKAHMVKEDNGNADDDSPILL
ncbi:PREDICTED: uncharacterized protein LOC109341265 [Lupinus angustifolius]|uniref:uncharacterized protein LOC109341265 n=1 Tax=Lupinus angustifolius TaxID=3871 RepID=UPI00092FD4FA|nr:PREDICTED: uncharacterized protein LOC109341265 [Lupinus angustifolius]